MGGLAMMAFVAPRVARTLSDEDRAWLWLRNVVNFSTAAAAAVGVLILTGSYLSFLHVGSWTALIGTAYGRTLVLKLALAGAAMLIGGYNLIVISRSWIGRSSDRRRGRNCNAVSGALF